MTLAGAPDDAEMVTWALITAPDGRQYISREAAEDAARVYRLEDGYVCVPVHGVVTAYGFVPSSGCCLGHGSLTGCYHD